jgi:hypothetical protein
MCNPIPRALHSTVGIRSASKPQMRASGSFRAAVSLLLTRAPRDGVRMEIFERVVSFCLQLRLAHPCRRSVGIRSHGKVDGPMAPVQPRECFLTQARMNLRNLELLVSA